LTEESNVETVGTYLLFGGLIIAALAQVVAAVIAFRLSALQGVLALFVPGYVLLVAKRCGVYWQIVGPWLGGLVASGVGSVLLS
jgi:hypothetical protein